MQHISIYLVFILPVILRINKCGTDATACDVMIVTDALGCSTNSANDVRLISIVILYLFFGIVKGI